MGQPVTVLQKSSSVPGVLRFETNRTLTGMSKEIYHSLDDIVRERPPDVLARRLFESGGVSQVTVYGGIVTVQVERTSVAPRVKKIIEDLYLYYQPGDPPQIVTE